MVKDRERKIEEGEKGKGREGRRERTKVGISRKEAY